MLPKALALEEVDINYSSLKNAFAENNLRIHVQTLT
jgi:hypothetical protein